MQFIRSRRPRRGGGSHFDIGLAVAFGPPPPALGGLSDLLPERANGVRSGVLVFEPGVLGGVAFSCATYFLRIRPFTCVASPGSFFFVATLGRLNMGVRPLPVSIFHITFFSALLCSSPGSRVGYGECEPCGSP